MVDIHAGQVLSAESSMHVGVMQGSSYMWRRLLEVRKVAEQNLWWVMRSGQCNFWFDNWLDSGPLCQMPTKCLRSFSKGFCGEWAVKSTIVTAMGP